MRQHILYTLVRENVPRPEEEILVVWYEKRDSRVCGQMRQLSEDQGRTSEARRFVAAVADSLVEMGGWTL
jgi:hypothetical protein